MYSRNSVSSYQQAEHYTDFDFKVIDYMSKLERQDIVKTYVSEARNRYKLGEYFCRCNNTGHLADNYLLSQMQQIATN